MLAVLRRGVLLGCQRRAGAAQRTRVRAAVALQLAVVLSRLENSDTVARNRFERRFRDENGRFTPQPFRRAARELCHLRIPYLELIGSPLAPMPPINVVK
jgi:hypothetical protein